MLSRGITVQWQVLYLLIYLILTTTGHLCLSKGDVRVCGIDSRTYKNKGKLRSAQSEQRDLLLLHKGPCSRATPQSLTRSSKTEFEKDDSIFEIFHKWLQPKTKIERASRLKKIRKTKANFANVNGRRHAMENSDNSLRWGQQDSYEQQFTYPCQSDCSQISSYPPNQAYNPTLSYPDSYEQPTVSYEQPPGSYQNYYPSYYPESYCSMDDMPPPPPSSPSPSQPPPPGHFELPSTGKKEQGFIQHGPNFGQQGASFSQHGQDVGHQGTGQNGTGVFNQEPDVNQHTPGYPHSGFHNQQGKNRVMENNVGSLSEKDNGSDEDIIEGNLGGDVSSNFGGTFQTDIGGSKGLSIAVDANGYGDAKLGTKFASQGDNLGGTVDSEIKGNVGGKFGGTIGGKHEKDFEGNFSKGRFSGTFGADFKGKFGGSYDAKVKGGKSKVSNPNPTRRRNTDWELEGIQYPNYPILAFDESIKDDSIGDVDDSGVLPYVYKDDIPLCFGKNS